MYPYIHIEGIQFSTYSICAFLGAILAVALLTYFWAKKRILHIYMPSLAVGLIGLVLGAKLFGVLSKGIYSLVENGNWNVYDSILNSGIVYWGGLLGFLAAVQLSCRRQKKNFADISDDLAVVIPFFHGFGRMGCFFAGCCYGTKCDGLLGMPYRIGFEGKWETRFPTQLTEAFFEWALFAVLIVRHFKKHSRQNAGLLNDYLAIYSVFRLFIEFYRADEIRGVVGGLSFSQMISLIVIVYIGVKITRKRG